MARPPTRKTKVVKEPPVKKYCPNCEKEQVMKDQFYNTSDTFFYPDGKLNICKKCCVSMIEEKGFVGLQDLMRVINKPLLDSIYDGDFFKYVRVINSLPKYKEMKFIESDTFSARRAETKISPLAEKLTHDELAELEYQFGEGYDAKDYAYMKYEFEDFCSKYVIDSKAMELLVREIVVTQLDIRKARASKQDVKALQKTLQELMTSANLKPVQETGSQSVDQESFGTLIKKWENEHPIPDPKPEWADVDGIRNIVMTYFTGHMARLLGKKIPDEEKYWEEMGKYTVKPPKEEDE